MPRVSEAASVQCPVAARAAEVGWTPLPSEDATAKRSGGARTLFRDDSVRRLAPSTHG